MPALCIPRRKSILIETIHHSQEPMSFFFFGRGEEQPGLTIRHSSFEVERSSASTSSSLCRSDFPWDSILPAFAEFRLRTVGFGLSPLSARGLRFLFSTARGIMRRRIRQLSRNSADATQRGQISWPRRYNFSLGFMEFMERRKFRLV